MQSFPMFIRTTGRRVVIAGGGEQAAQKARLMLKTDATIILVAPTLDDELAALVAKNRATHDAGPITPATFANTALVFIGTGCPGIDACLHMLAKQAGALVNVVDQPALCDATTPSIVDRDPVVVAIGTEGTAPVLARAIKTQVETMLDPTLGAYAALAGRLRGAVAANIPRDKRRAFWNWAFSAAPWALHKRGAARDAAQMLKSAIAAHGISDAPEGRITLVGAGPGARDLLTLRAVERLQEADVIFYDRLVDPDILEMARRDADRVFVGKVVGAHAWPQDRINALIVAEAARGRRVVRLKSGDPGVLGRATEEMQAAHAAGIPVEIVPGVTAAFAAAASMGMSLTQRGVTDTLVFATGASRDGDLLPDWSRHALPGTTVVFYMGVQNAPAICANLLATGLPGNTVVRVVAEASSAQEGRLDTTLGNMAADLTAQNITGAAVIFLTVPKALVTAPQAAVNAPKPSLAPAPPRPSDKRQA